MNPDEMYVRERWDDTRLDESSAEPSIFFYTSDAGIEFETWQAARAFTEQREEEIRQVEEEIALLNAIHLQLRFGQGQWHPFDRILAREQAALAELTRGMVGDGKGKR